VSIEIGDVYRWGQYGSPWKHQGPEDKHYPYNCKGFTVVSLTQKRGEYDKGKIYMIQPLGSDQIVSLNEHYITTRAVKDEFLTEVMKSKRETENGV